MERVLCFSASDEFKKRLAGVGGITLSTADNPEDLAQRAVGDPALACVVIHVPEADDFWIGFLGSLSSTLPLLTLLLVLDGGTMPEPEDRVEVIRGRPLDDEIFSWIEAHIFSAAKREKRRHQRFDWPLTGTLDFGERDAGVFRVREISADGAFLECGAAPPEPGLSGTIRIEFEDFSVLSGCRILPMRPATSKLPAGFGVQFTDLTEWSRKVIDSIVTDELVRELLTPGHAPYPPTIESPTSKTHESD